MAVFSGLSFNIGPYGKKVLKSSPLKPVSQYSKHVIDGHGMDGPWVVCFQNCVPSQPPSKMAAMSRHSFNIEPYGILIVT